MKPAAWCRLALLAAVLSGGAACRKAATPPVSENTDPTAAQEIPAKTPAEPAPKSVSRKPPAGPPPAELWKEFSGERAFAEVRAQVEFGPRPAASPQLEKARARIIAVLQAAGWEVERQEFTDETPRGPLKFTNVIARFSADGTRPVSPKTQRAIVCSHYDTKRFSTIQFVGASDGASSTGALLELARVLALDPVLASKVELVFFDGEEAVTQFTETDGLYGSRFYARQLRDSGRAGQFLFGILWDMIGDRDLTITLAPDSPPALVKATLASAEALGKRNRFSYYNRQIYDDHVPLNAAGIPTIDLIDFDYLYWHTADDTLDKLSPASLETIGAVTLHQLRTALGK